MSFHKRKNTFVDPRVTPGRRALGRTMGTSASRPGGSTSRLRRLPTREELQAAERFDIGAEGAPKVSPTHATKKVLTENQSFA